MVLLHPSIPRHSNGPGPGARVQARSRDISFHNINEKGAAILVLDSRPLEKPQNTTPGDFMAYIYDRIGGDYSKYPLADMITGPNQV